MSYAWKIFFSVALLCGFQPLSTSYSAASEIDYQFSGMAMGTLGGNPFSGLFSVYYVGDTNNVSSSPTLKQNIGLIGSFSALVVNTPTTVGLTGDNFLSLNTDPTNPIAPNIGFFQSYTDAQSNSVVVGEVLQSASLQNYDLKSSFFTTGNVNFGPQTYQTAGGDLNFSSISDLTFTASTPAVLGTPGPIAGAGLVPLFGLAGAWFARRRKLVA